MTNTTASIYSGYQSRPSSFAQRLITAWAITRPSERKSAMALACEINGFLHRMAEAIAPRFAEETADAGCTNARPPAEQSGRRKAWDMIAEAHTWNMLCDRELNFLAEYALHAMAGGRAVEVQRPSRVGEHRGLQRRRGRLDHLRGPCVAFRLLLRRQVPGLREGPASHSPGHHGPTL
jgi:hypothetical protein